MGEHQNAQLQASHFKPRTEATKKEFNALNLELTISFTLMKTTLINNTASNCTVDNLKLKSYSDFYFS